MRKKEIRFPFLSAFSPFFERAFIYLYSFVHNEAKILDIGQGKRLQ